MNYVPIVIAVCCAAFWHHAGREEMGSGLAWGGISLILSALVLITLQGGTGGVLLAQFALLAGITLFRMIRDKD